MPASHATLPEASAAGQPAQAPPSKWANTAFRWLTLLMAISVIALVILVGYELFHGSWLSLRKFGWSFFVSSDWDPVNEQFGALPFIFGTLISSGIALVIALPLSIATAIYLTELAPAWVRQPVVTLVEMLAAIPSVILGLWGIFILVPWLRDHPFKWLEHTLGFIPIFKGPNYGVSVLAAGVILAIMVVPIITSICREVFRSVPDAQREAAFALGATRWEVTRIAVLRASRRGIFGAAMLGLGRALGETMAVTMVIGNRPEIQASLLAPGYTLASAIANEFTEAVTDTYLSALFELGLMLLLVTIVTNVVARLLMGTVAGSVVRSQ